jgi:redox-sensing transcriptional repressor
MDRRRKSGSRTMAGPTLRRLSEYLMILEQRIEEGKEIVSSAELADSYSNTPSQVRQDVFRLRYTGRAGQGYKTVELADSIRHALGMDAMKDVAIIGCGKFGSAIAEHVPFERYGMRLAALFDIAPDIIGTEIRGLKVLDAANLETELAKAPVAIAGLCVPAGAAQDMASRLAYSGVKGILNFTRKRLKVPPGVAVRHMQIACAFMQIALDVR